MKIIISGGHLTPALAVIDYIKEKHPEDELIFLGRVFSQDKLKQRAVEQMEVEKRGVQFIPFKAVRFAKQNLIKNFLNLYQFITTIFTAKKIITQLKPDVFLSFGGYVAVPIAFACKLSRVPVITHEQTMKSGMANKIIGRVAKKVALSFESSQQFFPRNKVVFTGNPFRKEIFDQSLVKPAWIDNEFDKPILLIMGGNQGSKTINQVVAEALPKLAQQYYLIHQCGASTLQEDYLAVLTSEKEKLPAELKSSYVARTWIEERDLFWIYQKAELIVSRSGANTALEIALAELPAVLIPLPHAYEDEQALNAQWLLDAGGAVVLRQEKLNAHNLLRAILVVQNSAKEMKANLSKLKIETHAEEKIYQLLTEARS